MKTEKTKKIKKKIQRALQRHGHLWKMFLMITFIVVVGGLIFCKGLVVKSYKEKQYTSKEINYQLFEKINRITDGYPIQKMAAEISKQDEQVAAFLVAIAKKESGWGKHTPKYKGKECYNYWGFRRKRLLMGSGGHTCFDSMEDAVRTVGERIENLIAKGIDTPSEMVIWKCGNRCSYDPGAGKWIRDVQLYYQKIMDN